MDITYTYLYKLICNETSNVFYIGKTTSSYQRFSQHRNNGKFMRMNFHMEIIDKYFDKEDETINKFLKEGHNLLNVRKNDYILKEYSIGEKIIYDPYERINKMFN